MEPSRLADAAAYVMTRRLARLPVERQACLRSMGEGYAAQVLANRAIAKALGPVVGFKIGGTAENTRKLINVTEPVLGEVFASRVHRSGATLPFASVIKPGIETEIAVRLARPLPSRERPYSRAEAEAAIGTVMASIEIVDDRYVDFKTVGGPTLAADNVYNAYVILGQEHAYEAGMPLDRLGARTLIDGSEVATGTGAALMGHPLEALLFAAEKRRQLGLGLDAGSFITLGTMAMPQWFDRPMTTRIEIEQLGTVEVTFD